VGTAANTTELRHGPLRATVTRLGPTSTIALRGELDLSNVELVSRLLDEFEAGAGETIVLDLEQLDFIDSSGIAMLLNAHLRLDTAAPGRLRIVPSRAGSVLRMFRLTGLDERLPFVSDGPPA
jgi:anti-anti-sigma factor